MPTLNFDDLPGDGTAIGNGYGGLNWQEAFTVSKTYFQGYSGYANGTVSQANTLSNFSDSTIVITPVSGTFGIETLFLTSAWRTSLDVYFRGYQVGGGGFSGSQIVNTDSPRLISLFQQNIERLEISSSLGFPVAGASNSGNQFSIDNMKYTLSPDTPCYCSGTLIRTIQGEKAVEALAIGERAVTASGEARPITWIGHRTMACQGRKDVLPVRIAAGAFGEGRPSRDLLVSPAHAICVDLMGEVLIPAVRLVNGTTITQVNVEEVTYWHVELDSHDILLAENLPAESYLDCGNRRFFAEADATDFLAAPDARPEGPPPFCHPFHEAGPVVDLVRVRLEDRAEALGWCKVGDTFSGMHLVADGETIRPDVEGLTARFVLPAGVRAVRLVSGASVPAHVLPGSTDDRRLGLPLAGLTIDDGLTGARNIALDDPRLGEGFHAFDGGARWTNGSAVLPAALWDGRKGSFFLRVTLAGPALPRWIAPGETAGVVDLADRRQA